jgi:curved DNA-binding protein
VFKNHRPFLSNRSSVTSVISVHSVVKKYPSPSADPPPRNFPFVSFVFFVDTPCLMPAETDHYATLGLDRRCTTEQIRKAYRLLSKRHHPDLNSASPESVTRAQELNAAHEVLSDPARRRAYDVELEIREDREFTPPAPRAAKRDRNIAQDAHLRIADFLRGTTLDILVNDPGNPNGPERYQLAIPAGTAPGARFRIPRSEPFADGVINVRVRPQPGARFKVRGSDLRCDLRINARRAAEGGWEALPGPNGNQLRVQIPRGAARGETLRVPGEGLPKPHGGRGDLLVRLTYNPEVRISRA